MSVATTLRRPPVAEYRNVTATMAPSDRRLSALRTQTSSAVDSDSPTVWTSDATGSNSAGGSHWCHGKKGSAMRAAASSTMASTVQLKTVPK